jgi:hypothetical protein
VAAPAKSIVFRPKMAVVQIVKRYATLSECALTAVDATRRPKGGTQEMARGGLQVDAPH